MPTNKTTDPGRHIIVCLAAERAVSHCTDSGAIGRIEARVTSHAERRAVSSEPIFSPACRGAGAGRVTATGTKCDAVTGHVAPCCQLPRRQVGARNRRQ